MAGRTFEDFDEYVDEIQDVKVEMMINGLVSSSWNIRHLENEAIQIQEGNQGSGDITAGQSSPDGHFLYFPLRNASAQTANGIELGDDAVVIMEPSCDFYMNSNTDHGWCSLLVPTQGLTGQFALNDQPHGQCRVVQTPKEISKRCRSLIVRMLNAGDSLDTLESSNGLADSFLELRNFATGIINGQIEPENAAGGRPKVPRNEIVKRIVTTLERTVDKPLMLVDLIAACGVSERTLRTVFKEYFGLTPSRYLQLRRLHQIRRVLKAADSESTLVGDILVEHGEWEFGRFAHRYNEAFGELPSETLRAR